LGSVSLDRALSCWSVLEKMSVLFIIVLKYHWPLGEVAGGFVWPDEGPPS
jgi:hypothetical protein